MLKTKHLLFILACLLSLLACSKNSFDRHTVLIRVENETGEGFSNFEFNKVQFGSIAKGDTSIYRLFGGVYPVVFANEIYINNQGTYIIDLVPTPYLDKGRYLLKIETDTLPYRYKGSFIREQ